MGASNAGGMKNSYFRVIFRLNRTLYEIEP